MYKLISKTERLDLHGESLFEQAVNEALKDGWIPVGGVSITPIVTVKGRMLSDSREVRAVLKSQAMIKGGK